MSRAGPASGGSDRGIRLTSYAGFTLVGWIGLFVPSLLLVLQDEFVRTDAEFGVAYFVIALCFAVGALSSGLVAHRIGRRVVLPVSAILVALGMTLEGLAPSWAVFLIGAALAGLGSGAIDAVLSSVIMDLSALGSGQGLSLLHLFYSVGALAAPLTIGTLLALGVDWRAMAVATGLIGLALAAPLARAGAVRSRPAHASSGGDRPGAPPAGALRLALAALGLAIACYVASESGVSSWLVGFLADMEGTGAASATTATTATFALGLFWTGLAGGRLIASRVADRFEPVRFTVGCTLAGGLLVAVAVVVPSGPLRIACFTLAGLAYAPAYPMVMAVAGTLFPHRAAAVAGIVTAAGVAGSVAYPPTMGFVAGFAGLAAGMLGAAALMLAAAAAVVVAGRLAAGRDRVGNDLRPVPLRDAP